MTIAPPPSCVCSLVNADADDDNDDNDDDNALDEDDDDQEEEEESSGGGRFKQTKKKKYQQMRKKMNKGKGKGSHRSSKSGVIFSGVNSELSRKVFNDNDGVGEDDVLVLNAQWECEVVSVLNGNNNAGGGNGGVGSMNRVGGGGGLMQKRAGGLTSNNNSTLLMRKEPSAMGLGHSNSNRAPLGNVRKNTLMKKQPLLLQSKKKVGLGSGIGVKRTLGSTAAKLPSKNNASAMALPTAAAASGKMKKDGNGEWFLDKPQSEDDDSDDDEATTNTATLAASRTMSKVPPSLLRNKTSSLANKRPRTVPGLGSASLKSNTLSTNSTNNNDFFPGALGPTITVPASVRNILRPHQRSGIAFLWNCVLGVSPGLQQAMLTATVGKSDDSLFEDTEDSEDEEERCNRAIKSGGVPRGAVLADEMGLGKTLMTIATVFAYYRHARDRRFIIVCPSSLVSNWAKEFDKWLGKASQPKRVVVRNGAETEGLRNLKSFVPLKPNQSEVLILSYELFRKHVKVIKDAKKLGLLVVDEGHRLKNTNGSQVLTALNSINVEARILITGTPIQNNLSEFYNVANFAVPGILGDLNSFRRLYDRPMSAANQKNASNVQKQKGRQQSKALDTITSTFVLRRLQKDVLKSLLPPRMELLLFCKPTKQQCEIYRGIADRASQSIGSIGGVDTYSNPLMLLTEVRKLCTHPSLLGDDRDSMANDASLSGKLVVLANLLDSIRQNNPTDKIVIISNFTSALTVIEDSILRKKGLSFLRLDGSTSNKDRGPLVDSFNNGSVDHSFAFLLSSKAGGCGLNLIGANRLLMVDADWNPATDQQAMARVYRQGQNKPCFVYRMFTTGTVEEVIYQRQLQKGNLAKLANDGGNKKKGGNNSASFSKEELRDCFTLKEGIKCDTKRKLGKKWNDYSGAACLHSQGCMDRPLIGICEDESLTFVRVVDDEEESTAVDVPGDASEDDMLSESESEGSFSGEEDESSDEEVEFEG